jgi:hypothetical protein
MVKLSRHPGGDTKQKGYFVMKQFNIKSFILLLLLSIISCQSNKGTNLAASDYQKGIVRIYTFGELLSYERQYSALLHQKGIEFYHIGQSESDKIAIMGKYNEYMNERIGEKFGINFLDSLKSTIIFPSISHISISLFGIKDKTVQIAYTFDTKDSVLLETFRNYKNWIEAPDYRCVRNFRIILYFNNSDPDTLEAVISPKCNIAECKSSGATFIKFVPMDLVNRLLSEFADIQLEKGWRRL